jgi:hypothetical protein
MRAGTSSLVAPIRAPPCRRSVGLPAAAQDAAGHRRPTAAPGPSSPGGELQFCTGYSAPHVTSVKGGVVTHRRGSMVADTTPRCTPHSFAMFEAACRRRSAVRPGIHRPVGVGRVRCRSGARERRAEAAPCRSPQTRIVGRRVNARRTEETERVLGGCAPVKPKLTSVWFLTQSSTGNPWECLRRTTD